MKKSFIILPVLSEKAKRLAQTNNIYTFKIFPNSLNKSEIKKIIEKEFNVKVEKIRTINYQKRIRSRIKLPAVRKKFKKAYVKVKSGQKIDLFE